MELEVWKDIEGFEGVYQVSNFGNIRSLDRMVEYHRNGKIHKRKYPGKQMKLKTTRAHNYYFVGLSKGHQEYEWSLVHKLVLTAFEGPRPKDAVCRHLDGNSHNNRADNLKWGTQAENEMDKVRHGTRHSGERHPGTKITNEQASEIKAQIRSGKRLIDIANETGIKFRIISQIKRGRSFRYVA